MNTLVEWMNFKANRRLQYIFRSHMIFTGSTCFNKMLLMLFVIRKLRETNSINVALGARVTYCDLTITNVNDDSLGTHQKVVESCHNPGEAIILLRLQQSYIVHFVQIYFNIYRDDSLKSVAIALKEGPFTEPCGKVPIIDISEYTRIFNCPPQRREFSRVQVDFQFLTEFQLMEIEVHTLANRLPKIKHALFHRGCFDEFDDEAELLSWEKCHEKCLKHTFIFAGIKNKIYCGCKNNINPFAELPVQECDLLCDDGVGACGSKEAFSVYIVNIPLPHYKGCFPIGNESAYFKSKGYSKGSMLPIKCIYQCNDYNFALLQGGADCFCLNLNENDYSIDLMANSSKCVSPCSGKFYLNCGGEDHVAVYSTCKARLGDCVTCSELLMYALQYSFDEFGIFNERICKDNYIGDYCLERRNDALLRTVPVITTESQEFAKTELGLHDKILNFLKKNKILVIVVPSLLCCLFFLKVFCSREISSVASSVYSKNISRRRTTIQI